MTNVEMNIWGRTFDLEVEYDCGDNEKVPQNQIDAVEKILDAPAVMQAKEAVEKYCLAQNPEEIKPDHIDNIFKYVMPLYLFAVRNNEKRVVAIMCRYRFDLENGIAVVFENEKLKQVGSQDIIL